MRAVNLLPKDDSQAKSIRNEDPAVVVGSALGVIVLIALTGSFYMAHTKASAEQGKLTAARLELGKLSLVKRPVIKVPKKPTRPIVPVPAVTGEESARLQAVSAAMATRIAWDRILREFSLVVPDDVTISTLSMSAPTTPGGSTTGAPQGLTIMGLAYSHDSVARLLSRLMLIPDLSDVTLSSSTAQPSGSGVQFNISANVKGAPPPVVPTVTPPASTDTSSTDTTGASS